MSIRPQLKQVQDTQPFTTVVHIGKRDFDRFSMIKVDEETMSRFDGITAPMITAMVNNSLENRELTKMRDSLLPKLISGELDVSEIEI